MPQTAVNQENEHDGGDFQCPREAPAGPRVYVVSDVRLYREGLMAMLATEHRLRVVGTGSSEDVLARVSLLKPDVLIMDLGARDSLAIPHRAQQVHAPLRVVAFAVAETSESIIACAEAGISGYVTQDGRAEDLIMAVLCALKGELECSRRVAAMLFDHLASRASRRTTISSPSVLTRRECEIAELIANNLANKEIARKLRLGPATIKNHVHNILQKLNARRRTEIAEEWFKTGRWQPGSGAPAIERAAAGLGGHTHQRSVRPLFESL